MWHQTRDWFSRRKDTILIPVKQLLYVQLHQIQAQYGWSLAHPLVWVWLLGRLAQLALRWLRARVALRGAASCGRLVFTNGPLDVNTQGQLHIGERVRFWSTITPVHLRVAAGAILRIGHDCYINGAIISATRDIHIGNGVFLAPGCIIADAPDWRESHPAGQAIHIADHAWLATRCIILPGVHIGTHAVVGVGAVVTADVPPYAVVGGVPAKIIRYLDAPPGTNSLPNEPTD